MSSMRNAVQRRNHKERAQPIERERYGILEKHKDYSLRAKDFAHKKSRLRALRQKAANRNPDEFSFSMMSSRTDRNGVRIADRGNRPLSNDVVKLLKTQDIGYVRTMLQKTRKEREKAEQEIQILERQNAGGEYKTGPKILRNGQSVGKGQHTIFAESKEEQVELESRNRLATNRGSSSWRPGSDDMNADEEEDEEEGMNELAVERNDLFDSKELRRAQRGKKSRRRQLEVLRKREQDLAVAQQELDLQRARMNNTITGGVNKAGLKFQIRERKS